MKDNLIRIIITILAAVALWKLWGTPYQILWWAILVLIVLSWITALIIRRAAMFISIACLILAVTGIVLSYVAPPSAEQISKPAASPEGVTYSDDRENCRKAFMFFLNAQSLQWDADGNKFVLIDKEEQQLREYIRAGIEYANKVSDTFLGKIHPFLPEEFREHLVAGWELYLEGVDKKDEAIQEKGLHLLMQWENFREDNLNLLYQSIIKEPEQP
jgi:predicted PurR-regulated permease PerM